MNEMLSLAKDGIMELFDAQKSALA
jgi:hypothetical protein